MAKKPETASLKRLLETSERGDKPTNRNRSLQARYNKLRIENKRLKERIANLEASLEARIAEAVAEAMANQAAAGPTKAARKDSRPKRKKKHIFFSIAAILLIGAISAVLVYALDTGFVIPEGGIHDVVILQGNDIQSSAFVAQCEDMAGVVPEFRYPDAVDFSMPGRQEVVLTLQDGRRSATARATLYVLAPAEYVIIEAGTSADLINPLDFLTNPHIVSDGVAFDVQFLVQLTEYYLRQVGSYHVMLSFNSAGAFTPTGMVFTSTVYVVDTTPPTATPVNIMIPMGHKPAPEDFVANIYDVSPVVAVGFVSEPDFFIPGDQQVDIFLEDYFGNSAIYTATLTILPNLVPPRIYGAQDIFVQQGSPIMFRRGVSAYDAFDRPISFTVDSSGVDVGTLGVHTVIYHAVDAWGLTAEATANIYVLEVDPDRVRAMADTVLEGILRDGMTQVEQARAIFDWIGGNVAYSAHVRRDTLYENAYQGLRHRNGNCFVFYSLSEVMLTQAGIPNMQISRYGGTTRHTWNLINPDNLGWHHFDATPLVATISPRINRFMFTSSQAQAFTDIIAREIFTPNYFTYNPALYPEIVQ